MTFAQNTVVLNVKNVSIAVLMFFVLASTAGSKKQPTCLKKITVKTVTHLDVIGRFLNSSKFPV